jgi:dolichol-phosphate mannosyltransferase
MDGSMTDVSIIVPFRNEKEYAKEVISTVHNYFSRKKINFEIVAVDDSTDETWVILKNLEKKYKTLKVVRGWNPPGYGKAIRKGFEVSKGDILIPFNGDMCDSLDDAMKYVKIIRDEGYDMAFGSRYMEGGKVINYPSNKIIVSKLGNLFLRTVFGIKCSDVTNTFKGFSRKAIKVINPKANSYEIGLELALKGVKKGLRYKTIPISWTGRKYGVSKMQVMKSVKRHFIMSMKILFGVDS